MAYRIPENVSLWRRICIVCLLLFTVFSVNSYGAVFSVDSYGAKGNGDSDDSEAFLAAWNAACKSDSDSVFLVPEAKEYLVKPLRLNGPCKSVDLTAQISGRMVAPADPCTWNTKDRNVWIMFNNVQGLTINGGGIIDGQGQQWWAGSCNRDQNHICLGVPTAFVIYQSSNVYLRDLTFLNSQQIHIQIVLSKHIHVEKLQVVAPGYSPNTDGIHVSTSQHVTIQNCTIATGDDCVSIVTESSDIQINDLICGPGHGISIGSLGKNNAEDTVSDVVVNGATLTGTQNGLRIKTWQGGSGYAHGIVFQHVNMKNVSNPIIIDQYYCSPGSRCHNQTIPCDIQSSAVQVNNVTYAHITGTSATQEAIKINCSGTVPCENILLEHISLQLNNGDKASSFLANVHGSSDGEVNPPVNLHQTYI